MPYLNLNRIRTRIIRCLWPFWLLWMTGVRLFTFWVLRAPIKLKCHLKISLKKTTTTTETRTKNAHSHRRILHTEEIMCVFDDERLWVQFSLIFVGSCFFLSSSLLFFFFLFYFRKDLPLNRAKRIKRSKYVLPHIFSRSFFPFKFISYVHIGSVLCGLCPNTEEIQILHAHTHTHTIGPK